MIRRLPRGWGLIVCCDGESGARDGGCDARVFTANLLYGVNRAYAGSLGWGRGSVPRTAVSTSTKRRDLCPACLAADRARAARVVEELRARKEQRTALRRAVLQEIAARSRSTTGDREAEVTPG